MPTWEGIFSEINRVVVPMPKSPYDVVRYRYLHKLAKYTGRNVITYYSGWLTKPNTQNSDINDTDMQGFMSAVKGLDCCKGLDLILHTPGGSPTFSESIVNYLRSKFSHIRVIVPQLAMSAGTMIACSADEIIMGTHSSLGPVDPQINGIPAYSIIDEFENAKNDLSSSPQNVNYWRLILEKYPPAFVKFAWDAIKLSDELLKKWLSKYMFSDLGDFEKEAIVNQISSRLNENSSSKNHSRHFNIDFCKEIGLKASPLESDNTLQDIVLSLHHAYTLTLAGTAAIKIIENQNDISYIASINRQ